MADFIVFLIFALVAFIVIDWIINAYKNTKATFTQKSKRKETPIYTTSDIGREYIVLGQVQSSYTYYPRAEVELIEQAQKMGADAIVDCSGTSQTSTKRHIDKGALNISNDPRFYSVKEESTTVYNFHGTAVKFNN